MIDGKQIKNGTISRSKIDDSFEESLLGGGGTFSGITNITELKDIDTTNAVIYEDKKSILVESENTWYRFNRSGSDSESLPNIVTPNTGVGRWYRLGDYSHKNIYVDIDKTTNGNGTDVSPFNSLQNAIDYRYSTLKDVSIVNIEIWTLSSNLSGYVFDGSAATIALSTNIIPKSTIFGFYDTTFKNAGSVYLRNEISIQNNVTLIQSGSTYSVVYCFDIYNYITPINGSIADFTKSRIQVEGYRGELVVLNPGTYTVPLYAFNGARFYGYYTGTFNVNGYFDRGRIAVYANRTYNITSTSYYGLGNLNIELYNTSTLNFSSSVANTPVTISGLKRVGGNNGVMSAGANISSITGIDSKYLTFVPGTSGIVSTNVEDAIKEVKTGSIQYNYGSIIYVDTVNGLDTNTGKYNDPVKTLAYALTLRATASYNTKTVMIKIMSAGSNHGTLNYTGTSINYDTIIEGPSDVWGAGSNGGNYITQLNVTNCRNFYCVSCTPLEIKQTQTGSINCVVLVVGGGINNGAFVVAADDLTRCQVSVYNALLIMGVSGYTGTISVQDQGELRVTGSGTANRLQVNRGGLLYIAQNNTFTVTSLLLFYGNLLMDLNSVFTVTSYTNGTVTFSPSSVIRSSTTGTINLPVADQQRYPDSRRHRFNPGTSGLVATNVEDAIIQTYTGITKPTYFDEEISALVTTSDGDPATLTGITGIPKGKVVLYVNGTRRICGDGVKTKDYYWSTNGGTTALALNAVVQGARPYWNGSVTGFQLATTDIITYDYNV